MGEEIKEQVNEIVDNIYKYDITKIMNSIESLIKLIDISLQRNEIDNIDELNEVLMTVEDALYNKDYLLLADILEFQLPQIIPNKYKN